MDSHPAVRSAPLLETSRLRLRGHRREDQAVCAELWADPVVVRYIGGRPSTPQESWSRLVRYVGHWPLMGFGYWALEEKATGRFVGELGFADYQREITPSFEGAPEIGWALASWAHGQRFATEALQAVVAWGDAHLVSRRTVCLISPEHAVSIHLAQRLGYQEFARASYQGQPTLLFERVVGPGR